DASISKLTMTILKRKDKPFAIGKKFALAPGESAAASGLRIAYMGKEPRYGDTKRSFYHFVVTEADDRREVTFEDPADGPPKGQWTDARIGSKYFRFMDGGAAIKVVVVPKQPARTANAKGWLEVSRPPTR